ncbi:MAG: NAD(P)-binding domain-containing protein, partial [Actinomycetota bacterium]|nr:NAD(P)-binding domain-containing protein [Actinomycetota bacterium]
MIDDRAVLPPLAILGAGSMGGAVLRGVAASGLAAGITATNRSAAKAAEL